MRPTLARVREALFSILGHRLDGLRVADLCAGTGALGREALDRGAGSVVFVEAQPGVARSLSDTLKGREGDRGRVIRGRLPQALSRLRGPFDIILADPPYALDPIPLVLEPVGAGGLLDPDGVLVLEAEARRELPDSVGGLVRTDRRQYGSCALHFFRRPEALEEDP